MGAILFIYALETFFRAHNMRFKALLQERNTAIKSVTALTDDIAIIAPHRLHALVLIEQLRLALKAISQFDEEIEQLASQHTDYELFSCLPGAGPSLAPRLQVAFGGQRQRYKNVVEFQCYSGIAPVTERSGQ